MLQLYDKDYKIESVLSTGDKTLSFLYSKMASENIAFERYTILEDLKEIKNKIN